MRPGSTALGLLEEVTLPSLPSVLERLNALLEDPDVGTREVAAVIAQDAPIATRVLRIVNSAAYGLRERVLSTEHAAAVLGMRELRNVATQASVIGQFSHVDAKDFDLRGLWKHAILCARTSAAIAKASSDCGELAPEDSYTLGLLHDVGQVVLLEHFTDRFLEAARRAAVEGRELAELERELLGFSHAEVGARIALRWRLSPVLVSAIQYHHGPAEELEADPAAAIVDLANRVCHAVAAGNRGAAIDALDEARSELLGLGADDHETVVDDALAAWPTIEV
jgi:putative nucleotidyltransferase with HDIG domain